MRPALNDLVRALAEYVNERTAEAHVRSIRGRMNEYAAGFQAGLILAGQIRAEEAENER